jgi:hypothetical protein
VFLASLLALAGLGVSYAGFFDVIHVYGTVKTGTVNLEIEDYSGTDVWKIYAPDQEDITIEWRGFISDPERPPQDSLELLFPGRMVLLVASSWAMQGTEYDIDMVWDNIFPASISLQMSSSITPAASPPISSSGIASGDMTKDKISFEQLLTCKVYNYTIDADGNWQKNQEILFPVQMHYCEYIGLEVTIHLPQLNTDVLQDKDGEFSFDINALQWNDPCDDYRVFEKDPERYCKGFGVRYKSFANTGSEEVYLGVAANRVGQNAVWTSPA